MAQSWKSLTVLNLAHCSYIFDRLCLSKLIYYNFSTLLALDLSYNSCAGSLIFGAPTLLEKLNLNKVKITNDCLLSIIRTCPRLEELSLDETPINNASLEAIAELKYLTKLDIANTSVTNLCYLKSHLLLEISIMNTSIEDKCLTKLTFNCPNLTVIKASGSLIRLLLPSFSPPFYSASLVKKKKDPQNSIVINSVSFESAKTQKVDHSLPISFAHLFSQLDGCVQNLLSSSPFLTKFIVDPPTNNLTSKTAHLLAQSPCSLSGLVLGYAHFLSDHSLSKIINRHGKTLRKLDISGVKFTDYSETSAAIAAAPVLLRLHINDTRFTKEQFKQIFQNQTIQVIEAIGSTNCTSETRHDIRNDLFLLC